MPHSDAGWIAELNTKAAALVDKLSGAQAAAHRDGQFLG
jgi:hypothetical protein